MDNYQSAIGRDVGKVDTDSGGLARYSVKLQLPPGTTHDTEPELSLEYCQGTSNGSLGSGWALGGLSCIRRGPSSLAYDGSNPAPANYDVARPKLNLDGAELLNVSGEYDAPGAQYSTEIENVRRTVYPTGSGFTVRESTGKRSEYGTEEDARVMISSTQSVREWRLKRVVDYHGNFMTYNYTASPRKDDQSTADVNTCYLSSIRYSGNEKTGDQGSRIVRFEYASRPDSVVQTVQGDKCTWASLLSSIQVGVIAESVTQIHRAYELAYSTSPDTGDSCLTSVTEVSYAQGSKVSLLPSTFGYMTALPSGTLQQDLFKQLSSPVATLPSTTNNVALFPLNVSGRCLSDLACIRYNAITKQTSIKTYLAERRTDGTVAWKASTGPGAEATLQSVDMRNGFPSILSPDMNNDGRADFLIPYPDSDNRLCFSISQCVGTGYQNSRPKKTDLPWTPGAKFMAMDLTGRGTVDIVQIYTDKQKLALRNFSALNTDGQIGLRDAVLSPTIYDNVGTIDWFQLAHAITGAKSLVRVWAQDLGKGQVQLKATAFSLVKHLDSRAGFKETTTSLLGNPISAGLDKIKPSVLPCDINADGVQDIVLATAEWKGGKTILNFDVYLGDGAGGFKKHGGTITRAPTSEAPLTTEKPGEFHVTNLNGSNYPSLSYVYQEKISKSYSCISVDGRSDGLINEARIYTLAKNLPAKDMQITSADINGNGMGDWLFHTLDGDVPRIVPVYNQANVTGLLSWAQDSMGLQSTLRYGCLSDETVYKSGIDWTKYENALQDSYPLIAGPNYVVTQLEHRNNTMINSFAYNVLVKKSYGKARVNFRGRGWQGFEEIHTENVHDGVLTTEKYLQAWPYTGIKSQIDTKRVADGVLLQSIRTAYKISSRNAGPWKIYRSDRLLDQTDMIESGSVVRSNATEYQYDDAGNMTLRSIWERQQGQLLHQSWKRCAYATIDGVTNVLLAEKISAVDGNVNMSVFESGDCSLTLYVNDTARAILKSVSTWSTDVSAFSTRHFSFNEYGKEAQSIDAAGLRRVTIYDAVFHASPVKVIEEGLGISTMELTAYDSASGLEVARRERTGLLTCYRLDGFGRVYESRALSDTQTKHQLEALQFLGSGTIIADASLQTILSTSYLDPQREISFERLSSSGSAYLAVKVTTYAHEGLSGRHEVTDYIDCLRQVRKRSSRDADDPDATWLYWELGSRGEHLFESFPAKVELSAGLDWQPDPAHGIRSTMDTLGRPLTRVRPAHRDGIHTLITSTTYLDGGAKVQEKRYSAKGPGTLASATHLASLERRYMRIEKDDLVIMNVDENGLKSTFQYDPFGRLLQCRDPAGQIELRAYNSHNDLISVNNVYQNATDDHESPAHTYKYDASSQLVGQTNAASESITYQRDCKGRLLEKSGSDGKLVRYTYDKSGVENLASVAVYSRGATNTFDTHWDYAYDHRGRVKERKLTMADGSVYSIALSYDWQDQVVRKITPDGATLDHQYHGSRIKISSISSALNEPSWTLKAETTAFSPSGRSERLVVSGNSLKSDFVHEWKHDSQGFPISHGLVAAGKTLVHEDYFYNDLDQMARKHELLSGLTTDYTYEGKRLASSRTGGDNVNLYAYDPSGNLISRRGTAITYQRGRAFGVKNNKQTFEVAYDAVGRTARRVTDQSAFDLKYDAFGSLKSMKDSKQNTAIEFLTDCNGEMIQRKHSDGTTDLFVDTDFSIHVQSDGTSIIRHKLQGSDDDADGVVPLLASISQVYETRTSKSASKSPTMTLHFADTKGNVTHVFKGADATLQDRFDYDDFGLLAHNQTQTTKRDTISTYEGNYLDNATDLINFRGRWYDPLVGRFATPDDILDIPSLIRTDGLNRYAFENNDPINNVDPTGHWSLSSVLGVVIGVALVVAAVAVTVATGGAAAPLAAMAVGALASGGVAGITYSVKHNDEADAGKFWGGFATTVAINAAIGAATGAAGAFAGPARVASTGARMLIKGAIGGVSSVVNKAAERGVENLVYGKHENLFEGAWKSFAIGFGVGFILGGSSGKASNNSPNKLPGINKFEGSFKLRNFSGVRQILEPKPTNPWLGLTKEFAKAGGKAALKPGAKLATWGAKELGWDKAALGAGRNLVQSAF